MKLSVEEIKNRMESMIFYLGQKEFKTLTFTVATQMRFGVHFLQRIETSLGYATVIGELLEDGFEPQLYVWLDKVKYPGPLPLNQHFSKDVNVLHRLYPSRVIENIARRFNNCPLKTLIAAGNTPLSLKDIKSGFMVNPLDFINRAEENWPDWLDMACYYFDEVTHAFNGYIKSYFNLPLESMERIGRYSHDCGLNWHDFPFTQSSCYIKNEIDGVNKQLDYLQLSVSQPNVLLSQRESLEKLVALLTPPLQKRRVLLQQWQQAPLNQALEWQRKQAQAKQEFEWLFSNIHYQHFDTHSRIMQFIFNTWIEIQGRLNEDQQEQNNAILLQLSEYAYHEALKEESVAESESEQENDPWPPYYLWAFVFAISQDDKFIKKASTHLLIQTLCPEHIERSVLIDFEQWCQTKPKGVKSLWEQLLNNKQFQHLKDALNIHEHQLFQFEMAKLAFYYVKAVVELDHLPPAASAKRFAEAVLPALSQLILKGYQPAINFVVFHLIEKPEPGFFLGAEYNLAVTLIIYYGRSNQLLEAWSVLRQLDTFDCAVEINRELPPPEMVAMLQVLFNEKTRETSLQWLISQVKSGPSEQAKADALDALHCAGQFSPVAALAYAKHCTESRETKKNTISTFINLAKEADPIEAAYLNYLFLLRQKKVISRDSLFKAASHGHHFACIELERCMSQYLEEKNIQLIKNVSIPALLQGKIQHYLSPTLVVNTLIFIIDTRAERDRLEYASELLTPFITALIKENSPNRNTLITLLLAQAEGRFSDKLCETLGEAMDKSQGCKENDTVEKSCKENQNAPLTPSFARQAGLFAQDTRHEAANKNNEAPASCPGSNSM